MTDRMALAHVAWTTTDHSTPGYVPAPDLYEWLRLNGDTFQEFLNLGLHEDFEWTYQGFLEACAENDNN